MLQPYQTNKMPNAAVETAPPEREIKRLRDLKQGSSDCIKLDPRLIVIEEGHNPRDYTLQRNREHLDALKASIKVHGVQQALWVRWDSGSKSAILVDGECRLRATLELIAEGVPIETVPVIQKEGGNEATRLVLAITANTGLVFSKWEDGSAYKRLTGYGWSPEKIATETGKPVRYIKEAIELSEAPHDVKELLSDGTISPALALATIRKKGDGASAELQKQVAAAKASAPAPEAGKEAAKVVVTRKRNQTQKRVSAEDAAALTATLQKAIGILQGITQPDLLTKESPEHVECIAGLTKGLEMLA